MNLLLKLIQNSKGQYSSARVINMYGAFIMSLLIIYDTYVNKKSDVGLYAAFAAYCAGAYGVSKGMDVIETRKEDKRVEEEYR